jgi:hypothetical protein
MHRYRRLFVLLLVGIAVVAAGCAGNANPPQNNQTPLQSPTVTPMTPSETLSTDQSQETPVSTTATVNFPNQTTNGTAIAITNATLPGNGFIAIINGCANCHPLTSPILGTSPYLEQGEYEENIPIPLNSALTENRTLRAVLLNDTNGDRDADYDGSDEVVANTTNAAIDDSAYIMVDNGTEADSPTTATSALTGRTEPKTTGGSPMKSANSSTSQTHPEDDCLQQ